MTDTTEEIEGPVGIAIVAHREKNVVAIEFQKRIKWVAMPPEEATKFAAEIMAKVKDLQAPERH